MSREDLVLCGAIQVNGEYTGVFCNTETGELSFDYEDAGVSYAVGEVSVLDPVVLPNLVGVVTQAQKAGLMGAVYTRKGVLAILSEYTAEWRPLGKMDLPTNDPFVIDTNIEADIED